MLQAVEDIALEVDWVASQVNERIKLFPSVNNCTGDIPDCYVMFAYIRWHV